MATAANTLSDKAVKAAIKQAATEGKARKISDGGGLVLDARPTGSGWWRLRYWHAGKEGMLSLGTYPETSLAEARARRDEAKKLIAKGIDPSNQRKADKKAQEARSVVDRAIARGECLPGSFEAVAREWLETVHQVKVSAGHAERTRIRFEQDVSPTSARAPLPRSKPPSCWQCCAASRVGEPSKPPTAPRMPAGRCSASASLPGTAPATLRLTCATPYAPSPPGTTLPSSPPWRWASSCETWMATLATH